MNLELLESYGHYDSVSFIFCWEHSQFDPV